MIAIKLNGEYLEIADSVQIQVEQYNSLFDFESFIQGDRSVDFALKKTEKNCRLFNYINRIDTNETFANKYPVEVYVDGQLYNIGELKVTSIDKEFKCYLLFGKGTFYDAFATKMKSLSYSNYDLEIVNRTAGFVLEKSDNGASTNFSITITVSDSSLAVIQTKTFNYIGTTLQNYQKCKNHVNNHVYNGSADDTYFTSNPYFRLWVEDEDLMGSYSAGWGRPEGYAIFFYLKSLTPGYFVGISSNTHLSKRLNLYTGSDPNMQYYRLIYQKKMIAYNAAWVTYNDSMPFNFLPVYNESFSNEEDYLCIMNAYESTWLNHNHIEWGAKKKFVAVPFFSFKWYVEKAVNYIQTQTGYTFTNKINDVYALIANIYMYNTNALSSRVDYNNSYYGEAVQIDNYDQLVRPINHIPDLTISQLMVMLRKMFSLRFKVDAKAKTIDLITSSEVISTQTSLSLNKYATQADSYNSSFKNLSIALNTADAATQNTEKKKYLTTLYRNYAAPKFPAGYTLTDQESVYMEVDQMFLWEQEYNTFWVGEFPPVKNEVREFKRIGYINNNIEYPVGNSDNKAINLGFSTLLQDINGYASIPVSIKGTGFGEYFVIKDTRYCVVSDASGAFDLSNEVKDLILIAKTGYDTNTSSIHTSMNVPRSGAIMVQTLYNSYWKTFLEKIEADKYYKIKALLPLHYLQQLQENGKFYLHNREFIFESISTNLINKAESARMYEVEIVAYRLK